MAFPPLGNSDHVVASVSFDTRLTHHIAYNYSRANWDGLPDYLRDAHWEDNFKFSASAGTSKLCEWILVAIDLYISHHKYHVKPH